MPFLRGKNGALGWRQRKTSGRRRPDGSRDDSPDGKDLRVARATTRPNGEEVRLGSRDDAAEWRGGAPALARPLSARKIGRASQAQGLAGRKGPPSALADRPA